MSTARRAAVPALALVLVTAVGTSAAVAPDAPIRLIPSDDVAQAGAATDDWGPVIYYNPEALRRIGPELTRFVLAHEYAHHHLGHVPRARTRSAVAARRLELRADCRATRMLAKRRDRKAIWAAIAEFKRQGATAATPRHPIGVKRVETIVGCWNRR